jgi:glutathione S-transferase
MSHPARTYHLAPRPHWDASDPAADYVPEHFAREGFIHTTHQPDELVAVANRYYGDDARPYVVLHIDVARVRAPIAIEDPGGRYPHIYGPLNRDAIVAVTEAVRNADGSFRSPLV